MKVILVEEVPNVGAPGEVVNVAAGYARNYLLPRKLAIQATRGNVKALQHHQRTIKAHQRKVAQSAAALGERIGATPITLTARAGEAGRLYGSVTSADVAAELGRAFGLEVDKRKIEIPEPIKVLGEHTVKVRLHRDIEVAVTVTVIAEEEPVAAEQPISEDTEPTGEATPEVATEQQPSFLPQEAGAEQPEQPDSAGAQGAAIEE